VVQMQPMFRALSAVIVAVAFLSACGGSHSGGQSTLPPVPNAKLHAADTTLAAGTDVVALNAGGSASGSFAADADFAATGTWTYKTTSAIDTSGVANAGAQAVYQDEREGSTIAYTIPGLTAGTQYTVRLSFAELWWTAKGQRVFNINVNNVQVLGGFDVFAAAGARNKAVTESFAATASSAGTITVTLSAVTNNAAINALEIVSGGGTSTPTPVPTATPTTGPGATIAINSGGSAAGSFAADEDLTGSGTWTYKTANAIDTSGVTNPAPQAAYQDEREGSTVAYSIPGLTAGAAYTVRLDFAELWWTGAGQRVFNINVNNQLVNNFDVFAAAGNARYKAVAKTFNVAASATGTIAITLTAVTNYAAINAVEVTAGNSGPTPTPTPTAAPTATPTAPPSTSFVDWPTYAYDAQRSGFNPYTTAITPGSIGQLHVGWQTKIGGSTQTQPIVATNVGGHKALLIVGNFAVAQAYDALTGAQVWTRTLPTQDVQDCGIAGVSGSAQYDKGLGAVFMAAGAQGGGRPNHTWLYRLDVATGSITGSVDVTPSLVAGESNYSHSGVTLANGRIYLGTGSDCEGTASGAYPSWRGRVVSVDPSSMALLSTFYTTWGQGGSFGGGGVWGWGGVSADPSGNVFVATGNAETNAATKPRTASAPFQTTDNEQAGYAEHLVKLSSDLATVEGSNYPGFNFTIGYGDLDYEGTPVVFQPPVTSGCGLLTATQGKGGTLVVNSASTVNEVASFKFSVPSGTAYYIGNPAYSPNTGYLYAAITSAGAGGSLLPPGLAAIGSCGTSIAWNAQFGPDSTSFSGENPRSAPTVTAGGVVFVGTPCTSNGSGGCGSGGAANGAVWAVDAATGSVLNGGKPVLITADNIRMAPSVDGLWVFVLDGSGNLSGLTIDPSVKAVASVAGRRIPRSFRVRGN
jgi:hypothetical protein